LRYHWIQVMCKICHIFSLFVAIATRIFSIRKKEKDVHNLHTAIYLYIKLHKNIFSTFCVIAGSSFVDERTDGRTDGRSYEWAFIGYFFCLKVPNKTTKVPNNTDGMNRITQQVSIRVFKVPNKCPFVRPD
jgi:hypothetical protein